MKKRVRESNQILFTSILVIILLTTLPAAAQSTNIVKIANNITAPHAFNTTVPILIHNATGVAVVGIKLSYNPDVVCVIDAEKGDFTDYFGFDKSNAANGWVTINTFVMGTQLTGNLVISSITLEGTGSANDKSSLNLEIISIANQNGSDISATTDNGFFTVSDITPPLVSGPYANPPLISNDGTTTSRLSITALDESSIDSVTVDLSAINGPSDEPMTRDGDVWSCTTNAFAFPGIYELLVTATDSWGNSNTSITIPLKIVEPALISIGSISISPNESITIPVMIYNAADTASIGLKLSYDASVVNVTGSVQGDFTDFFGFDNSNAANGWITINTFLIGARLTGDLLIANVTLHAVGNGKDTCQLSLSDLVVTDNFANNVPWTVENGTFSIRSRPPVLDPISDKSIDEGQTLSFMINAADPDGDTLKYSTGGLPDGAVFDSASRTFTWTPDYDQSGSYQDIHFEVNDGELTDWENITIRVNNVNRAPILGSIGSRSVDEGSTLTFTISAVDPDGDTLTYSAKNLPDDAVFDPATHTFSWMPDYDQSGSYPDVRFTVSDGELADQENITITVNNINRAPVISGLIDQSGIVNLPWSYNISSCISDPDGDLLTVGVNDDNISVMDYLLIFNYSTIVIDKTVNVTVTDTDGLSNSQTVFVTVKELTPPLLIDPSSSQLIPDDTDGVPLWGETSTLTITVIDDNQIAGVTIDLSAIGGSADQHMDNIAGNIWSVSTNATAGTSPKLYHLQINATDIYSNSNISVSIPIVVMRNGDVNGDNKLNIVDAMLLANNVSLPGQYIINNEYVADVTGDGNLTIVDAMLLANHISYPAQGYILH